MAINFLQTVDLNQNSLDNARIQNLANDPATGVVGQIIFNTTADTLKQYVADKEGSGNPGWVEVGSDSVTAGFGIGVTLTGGNAVVRNTGLVTVLDGTYIDLTKQGGGDNTQLTADLSAVDGTSVLGTRFLSKDNTWDVPAFDNYSGWTLNGQSGTPQVISSGNTALFQGGTKITTAVSATDTLTISHDLQAQTNTTSTAAPGYGATFTAIDIVLRDSTGHVTGVNTKTITIPASDDTTYTLPVTPGIVTPGTPTSGVITLTDSNSVADPVNFVGTTNRIDVSGNAGTSAITIDLTDDVTIVDDLTVGGIIIQQQDSTGIPAEKNSFAATLNMNNNKLENVKTGTAGTDGVNLGQVEALVAGLGSFQGGYNAATNTPALSGASNVAVGNGDFYVVTEDGTLFTKDLEVGDMIFANTNIAINSSPVESNYTYVIADANIAGAGSTDGGTEKGVAGFDSAHFDVSSNGWVQLNSQRNPYGAKQVLNNTAPSSRAEAGGQTTFTIDISDSSLFGTSALAENVKVEVTDGSAPYATVYACVSRSGSASMTVAFTGSIANGAYQVLLTYV
tara:strand:- start:38 stop:1732 length:1695 start_codon:yes stop_codon:yes gene_type:complete